MALVRRAYGRTLGHDEIDDIYASAWLGTLKALERKHADLDNDEIRSYLLTAVANHAHKEMRRRHRKPIAPLEDAGSVAEVASSPEDLAATRETGEITKDLLSSLPPRRRAVMLLRYGWGLEPREICSMVSGLSPRAYRKEITKGVDDLTERLRLVREGSWCEEREPILKAFAAGVATEDQTLQAQHHMSHCRSCSDFVGKLTGHLNDLGSSLLLPGALEAADGHSSVLGKLRDAADHAREAAFGAASRGEVGDGITLAAGSRGTGAAGMGVLAKLSGLGSGAKAAMLCVGGGVAATACVAVGVNAFDGGATETDTPKKAPTRVAAPKDLTDPVQVLPQETVKSDAPTRSKPQPPESAPQAAPESAPVLAPDTPPTSQEFGVESAAAPAAAPSNSSGGSSEAVNEEFGP